jgi:hypothetical protein
MTTLTWLRIYAQAVMWLNIISLCVVVISNLLLKKVGSAILNLIIFVGVVLALGFISGWW